MLTQEVITKQCPRCGQTKSTDEFHNDTSTKDGLCTYCKVCRQLRHQNQKKTDTISRKIEDIEFLPKEKKCGRCRKIKPQSEFNFNSFNADGLTGHCFDCRKERNRDSDLRKDHGITQLQYALMLKSQNGACKICGKTPDENGKLLAVDHDHKTGKIRGLLCSGCNLVLGHVNDSSEQLRKAADYLDNHA